MIPLVYSTKSSQIHRQKVGWWLIGLGEKQQGVIFSWAEVSFLLFSFSFFSFFFFFFFFFFRYCWFIVFSRFFFSFYCHTCGIWKFPGLELHQRCS